jgi:hypothetical protein
MNPITVFLTVACLAVGAGLGATGHLYLGIPVVVIAIIIASALKMANTWQKFVILRAGKLRGVKGPGLFLIIPVIDHVVAIIDERIQTTAFSAEAALTKDTVPVNVDAIIFWFVHDAQKAALNITDYREAIDRVSQTSLREMIGSSMLSALLSERTAADDLLRGEIGRKTADWGISVKSVEIRDVAIPVGLLADVLRKMTPSSELPRVPRCGIPQYQTRGYFEPLCFISPTSRRTRWMRARGADTGVKRARYYLHLLDEHPNTFLPQQRHGPFTYVIGNKAMFTHHDSPGVDAP